MAKAHYIGVDGVGRKGKQPFIGVDGVSRKCKSGYVGVDGVARQFFISEIIAGELPIGSIVKLLENNVETEYIVVNQGIPSGSSLYDSSCDGTWMLRKNILTNKVNWSSEKNSSYSDSNIHSYLNSTFYNGFGTEELLSIKKVKIPYRPGSGISTTVNSGSKGLQAYIFLPCQLELGFDGSYAPTDGAELSYFADCNSDGNADTKRVAYNDSGLNKPWLTRSPTIHSSRSGYVQQVKANGGRESTLPNYSGFMRPALILKSDAIFDGSTMMLKV